MSHLALLEASADFLAIADHHLVATQEYLKAAGIRLVREADFTIAGISVAPVFDCGNGRFDLTASEGAPVMALVCEALDADAETVIDLVAWPLDCPEHVMTMFGRCVLLGAFEAMNPSSYILDYPLPMHRTPFAYMRAGFRGAAIVTPQRAARMLIDLPGRVAAQDFAYGRELVSLMQSVIPADRVVVARSRGRMAE